jgi:hypothetical protein
MAQKKKDEMEGITIEGKSLKTYFDKKKAEEVVDETIGEIFNMAKIKAKGKPVIRHNEKASWPTQVSGGLMSLTDDEKIKLMTTLEMKSSTAMVIHLMGLGHVVSAKDITELLNELQGKNLSVASGSSVMNGIWKSNLNKLFFKTTKGRMVFMGIKKKFLDKVPHTKIYDAYDGRNPYSINNLMDDLAVASGVKAPSEIIEGEEIEEEEIEGEGEPVIEDEQDSGIIEKVTDTATNLLGEAAKEIEDGFKLKFGKDLNINLKIEIKFGLIK